MRQLSAPPPRYHWNLKPHVPDALSSCSYVFIRHDAIKQSLQPPYTAPFPIVKHNPKYLYGDCQWETADCFNWLSEAYLLWGCRVTTVVPYFSRHSTYMVNSLRQNHSLSWQIYLLMCYLLMGGSTVVCELVMPVNMYIVRCNLVMILCRFDTCHKLLYVVCLYLTINLS